MSATAIHVCDDRRFEYRLEVTEGFAIPTALGDKAGSWFGTAVRYRLVGERRWRHFNAVDVHSWELPKLMRAIEAHYVYDGTP